MNMNTPKTPAIEIAKRRTMDLIVASMSLVIGMAIVFRQEVTFLMVGT